MNELLITFDENGVATEYDDTYDIIIHCETEEDNERATKQIKDIGKYEQMWKQLQEMVADSKMNMNCENKDYETGFLCALSNVEGMMTTIELDNK